MRSSSGQHFVALDQVRGVAAFLVVAWHFLHGASGTPVPFEGAPAVFPLALADEGHTGVALFMVLSGSTHSLSAFWRSAGRSASAMPRAPSPA